MPASMPGGSILRLALVLHAAACLAGEDSGSDVPTSLSQAPKPLGTLPPAAAAPQAPAAPAPVPVALRVVRAMMVQVQQRDDGSIPMVAGRDAYLRIFLTADRANQLAPAVRARLLHGGETVYDQTLPAQAAGVGQAMADVGDWAATWNFAVPGHLIVSGLALRVDVDPARALANVVRGTYPAGEAPAAVSVVEVQPYHAVAVPVASPNPKNLTGPPLVGNVDAANLASYYALALAVLPVADHTLELRATPFSTDLILQADGTHWSELLTDLQTAHYADSGGAGTYWFGITHLPYTRSGVCGIDVVGGTTGLAEDDSFIDMPWARQSVAHEEGHGFGLLHAPCGSPADVDPAWPADAAHSGAKIATWGLDAARAEDLAPAAGGDALVAPTQTDIMSYCNEVWMSDFSYQKALDHQTVGARLAAAPASDHLVLAGRVVDGKVVVDHALRAQGDDRLPPPGPYQLQGLDAAGAPLFSIAFAPSRVGYRVGPGEARPSGDEGSFFVAVPLARAAAVSRLVTGAVGGAMATLRRPPALERLAQAHRASPAQARLGLRARRTEAGVELTWESTLYTKAFVFDPRQGPIGTVRAGRGVLLTDAPALDVHLSDGLDALVQQVRVE